MNKEDRKMIYFIIGLVFAFGVAWRIADAYKVKLVTERYENILKSYSTNNE